MRHIKLYEEFIHDEIHDVMMSICDTVSFKESEEYPSTDNVRVYETAEPVEFDTGQYEEYLDGWKIKTEGNTIVFINGDFIEVGLTWLNEVYGNLKPVKKSGNIYYVDDERKPLFYYYKKNQESKNGYYYINFDRIWSFFRYYFGLSETEIKDLMTMWLGETYKLRGLTPDASTFKYLARLGETYKLRGLTPTHLLK